MFNSNPCRKGSARPSDFRLLRSYILPSARSAPLFADILDVARVNGGHVELRHEMTDLRTAVEHAIETEQPGITAAQLDLSTNLPSEPVWIEGDALRLEQIIANLVDNAVKYTDPGGRIELTLEVADPSNGHGRREAIVRVLDTGVGIEPDQLSKVFEVFMRGEVSSTRRTNGLGIGLSLVENLVELHSGTVEAYSAGPGKGSRFTVRLPLGSETKHRNQTGAVQPSISAVRAQPSTTKRILVIDDNADAAEALAELLRSLGHDVQIALSGPDGLRSAAVLRPEVVFVDIAMPGMDGYEVVRQLRRQTGPKTKLLALSGYGSDEDRRRSLEAGFDTHLVKPMNPNVLTNILGD